MLPPPDHIKYPTWGMTLPHVFPIVKVVNASSSNKKSVRLQFIKGAAHVLRNLCQGLSISRLDGLVWQLEDQQSEQRRFDARRGACRSDGAVWRSQPYSQHEPPALNAGDLRAATARRHPLSAGILT